jgi:hypothetical protein
MLSLLSRHSCTDTELFDAGEMLFDGCIAFVTEHQHQLVEAVRSRLHSASDEFGEDLVPRLWCSEVGACTGKSMDQSLEESREQDRYQRSKEL